MKQSCLLLGSNNSCYLVCFPSCGDLTKVSDDTCWLFAEATLDRQHLLVLDHTANSSERLPELLGRKETSALFLSCPRCENLLEAVFLDNSSHEQLIEGTIVINYQGQCFGSYWVSGVILEQCQLSCVTRTLWLECLFYCEYKQRTRWSKLLNRHRHTYISKQSYHTLPAAFVFNTIICLSPLVPQHDQVVSIWLLWRAGWELLWVPSHQAFLDCLLSALMSLWIKTTSDILFLTKSNHLST